MFLVVTGNLKPEEVINIVNENQSKKQFLPIQRIKIKQEKEPKIIQNKKIDLFMNVMIPKIAYNFKIDVSSSLKKFSKKVLSYYFEIAFGVHFSDTSLFYEKLWKEK